MHTFFAILGWILLALLGVLLLVLVLPVFVILDYHGQGTAPKAAQHRTAASNNGGTADGRTAAVTQQEKMVFTAKLRLLFFLTFPLYPMPEKAEPPEPENPPQQKEEKKPTATKQKKAKRRITFDDILGIVSTAGAAMRLVLRGLWFTGIRIVWPVHEENPAQTAISYGQTQAYFGGAVATLRNFLNLRFKSINILADYKDEYAGSTSFYCKIGALPIIMVIAAIYALVRLKRENIL